MNKFKKYFAIITFTIHIIIYQSMILFFLALINFHKIFLILGINITIYIFILSFLMNVIHFIWVYIYEYRKTTFSLKLFNYKIDSIKNIFNLPPLINTFFYYSFSYMLIIPSKLFYLIYANFNYMIYKNSIFNINIIKYILSNIIWINAENGDGFFSVKIALLIFSFIYFMIQLIRGSERPTFCMNKFKIDLVNLTK